MNEPISILEKFPWLKYLMHGLGGGTGIMVVLASFDLLNKRPEFLQVVLGNTSVLWFVVVVVGIVVVDRRAQGFVDTQRQIANAVTSISQREDTRAEAIEASVRYLAGQNNEMLDEMRNVLKELKTSRPVQ